MRILDAALCRQGWTALVLAGCATAPRVGAQAPASADTAALMATVRILAADSMEGRLAGSPGGARARAYLLARLARTGAAPLGAGFEQSFALPGNGATGVNLLGVIRGRRFPERYLVLSAHYDHVGVRGGQIHNGADDNASGTAAVLFMAEALRSAPLDHSVVVALFDGEEGGLRGARAFLASPPVSQDSIALNVNLDMVGHNDRGELWVVGTAQTPSLRPTLDTLARLAPVTLRFGHDRAGVPGEPDWSGSSDHGPFKAAGIPFVYFGVDDHADYHKPTDDPDTLTVPFFGKAVRTILAALRRLDRGITASRAQTSP